MSSDAWFLLGYVAGAIVSIVAFYLGRRSRD